jgi:hypothetical protein
LLPITYITGEPVKLPPNLDDQSCFDAAAIHDISPYLPADGAAALRARLSRPTTRVLDVRRRVSRVWLRRPALLAFHRSTVIDLRVGPAERLARDAQLESARTAFAHRQCARNVAERHDDVRPAVHGADADRTGRRRAIAVDR